MWSLTGHSSTASFSPADTACGVWLENLRPASQCPHYHQHQSDHHPGSEIQYSSTDSLLLLPTQLSTMCHKI